MDRTLFHKPQYLFFIFAAFFLLFNSNSKASDLDYFPESYDASKARFLRYAASVKAKYKKVETSAIVVGKEKLTIDTLYIPAQKSPQSLIILTSGNHGPEGYAGSALQTLFFDEVLGNLNLDQTGVLLVHAMNPWGFKHNRRGTENNVNLNRNFDLSPTLFSTKNDEYMRLKKFIELPGEVDSSEEFAAKGLLFEMIFKKAVTKDSLTEAIGKGQYESPQGINFGGSAFESQTLEMIELLRKVVAPYSAVFDIDLHTGLGKKGILHVMTKKTLNEVSEAKQKELFNEQLDAGQYEVTPPEAEGFYDINGDYVNIVGQLYPEKNRVIIPITAEFGTIGNGLLGKIKTMNRLILENEGFYYGYRSPKVEAKVKSRYLELFNPSSSKWRQAVVNQGRYLLTTVVKRFIDQNQAQSSAK